MHSRLVFFTLDAFVNLTYHLHEDRKKADISVSFTGDKALLLASPLDCRTSRSNVLFHTFDGD
jgi:hypothetical protein